MFYSNVPLKLRRHGNKSYKNKIKKYCKNYNQGEKSCEISTFNEGTQRNNYYIKRVLLQSHEHLFPCLLSLIIMQQHVLTITKWATRKEDFVFLPSATFSKNFMFIFFKYSKNGGSGPLSSKMISIKVEQILRIFYVLLS